MSPITINTNQEAIFALSVTPAGTTATFSVTTSSAAIAYVAKTGNETIHIVGVSPGTCSITMTSHSQDNTLIQSDSISVTVTTPPPPQATAVTAGTVTTQNQGLSTPPDPGTPTVTGSLP